MNPIDYESDFYGWTQQQAHLLRTKEINQIDWNHLAEEIEDMGRSEKRQLESRLEILIMHLLKWQFQPNFRSRSWQLTIKEQRLRLEKLLQENPSLKSSLSDVSQKIYPLAVISAEKETGLSSFPETCPYNLTEILATEFFPEDN
jgi:serine phosphatase RsbU (regulator of sigma subunit)